MKQETNKLLDEFIKKAVDLKTSRIPGFYRLSVEQRLAFLQKAYDLDDDEISVLGKKVSLKVSHAVNMVENAIGVIGLPLGLGANFLINGRDYLIPMSIEEPSIIAASSKAALLIRRGGGFEAEADEPVMIGQIQLIDVNDPEKVSNIINQNRERIIDRANRSIPGMVNRGGGVVGMEVRPFEATDKFGPMLVIHISVNVGEAMGANLVNSAVEAAGEEITILTGADVNMRIVSNLADQRLARARFELPLDLLKWNGHTGYEVGRKLEWASHMAQVDPYRATTHNKGIYNGISAAAVALGQDWRAIESGGHAYAARDGQYRGLTQFKIEGDLMVGTIEIPMQLGWVGGTSGCNPSIGVLKKIIGVNGARELAGVLASVGLSQNFAACLALCTDGIQKGHMALHARSVAVSAGVPAEHINEVAVNMIRNKRIGVRAAEREFRKLRLKSCAENSGGETICQAFAPGKIILFGEHAIVYDYPGIIAAINQGLKITLRNDPDGPRFIHPEFKFNFPVPDTDRDFKQFSQAVNIALDIFRFNKEPFEILVDSELVPGAGMGSSAAFSVALCRAFMQYAKDVPDQPELAHTVHELEKVFHGNPSGADAAAIIAESVIWFRKSKPEETESIELTKPIQGVVCIVDKGARTSDMVNMVAGRRRRDPKTVDKLFEEIGDITYDARIALGLGDSDALGRLMTDNHEHLARLGVSSPVLDEAVDYLLDKGALGAKLTGAGGGGAVIALVNEDRYDDLVAASREKYSIVHTFNLSRGK